jgi:glycosyltransferase involved in cell wall biosynthesis
MKQAIKGERQKMRVVYVVNYPIFFLSHRMVLAERARAEGHHVIIITPDIQGADQIRAQGFEWRAMSLDPGRMRPWRDLRTILDLYRLFRELKPDVVHNITIKPVLYGTFAARLAGVPRVVNAISGMGHLFAPGRYVARRLGTALYRFFMRHPDIRVILQNREDMAFFESMKLAPPGALHLIKGSGVDVDKFMPMPVREGPPVILQTSRMIGDKGVREFIAAARLVKAARRDARFVLAGPLYPDNPTALTAGELEGLTRDGFIEWLGHRDDVLELLHRTHIYVLASLYREGVPKSLIEAAACGLAIVTTDISGCREVVTDGQTGLLVPPGDAPALAAAIEKLLTDPVLAARLGAAARKRAVAEFSLEQVLRAQTALYTEPASA